MRGQPVLIGVDCDGMHSEFVRCAEHTNGDFLVMNTDTVQRIFVAAVGSRTHSSIRDEDLRERSSMTRRLASHRLYRMHRRPRRTWRRSKVGREPRRVQTRCLAGRHRICVS